jgi:hypothetical protein
LKRVLRRFQAAIQEKLGVQLIVVGGGYGCSKIVFSISADSPDSAAKVINDLLENPIFRKEALEVDFNIVISTTPHYSRMNLRDGSIENFSKKQGYLFFYSYSSVDEEYQRELEKHLISLKRQGLIRDWSNHKIEPGNVREKEIEKRLEEADIILLLLSVDFVASDYCYSTQMKRAIEKHEAGESCVIPIAVRSFDWTQTPFEKLQVIPRSGLAIASWSNKDEAWTEITKEIRQVVLRKRGS